MKWFANLSNWRHFKGFFLKSKFHSSPEWLEESYFEAFETEWKT